MLAERKTEEDYKEYINNEMRDQGPGYMRAPEQKKSYRPIRMINTHLRSRCQALFLVISVLAMLVTVRSGISASRGYALIAVQQQTQQLEQENERLRIELARLKSPQRIRDIAVTKLGMETPKKMYFPHTR